MSIIKKTAQIVTEDASKTAGTLLGNAASQNAQNATDAALDGMSLFRWKVGTPIIQNGTFEAQKGNLFEYIEAAKFNADAASKGISARAVVTDVTNPSAEADILIQDHGKTVKEIQAKFIKTSNHGQDTSAAQSVFDQTGAKNKGWGQYDGMDRLIRKQDDYNAEGYTENGYSIGLPDNMDMTGHTVYLIEDDLCHITDYLVSEGFTNKVAAQGGFSIVYK